jgi:hypothetical protein
MAAALLMLVCALALPVTASASVEFEVNGTADEADLPLPGCSSAGGKCTLRAAIEEANASANMLNELDRISFDPAVFDGGVTSTIALGSSLPPITDPVRVNGGECLHGVDEIHGPCVGISGPGASNPALTIEKADGVEIVGLAITGASTGIDIFESEQVRVNGSWLGVKLDGSSGPNVTGIFVDPESSHDRIGGEGPGSGNVFANNSSDGLAILGADETLVLGNYFGVEPDGTTPAANGENIEVGSQLAGGFEAERTLIGVQGPFSEHPTPACDIGCNVIAGAIANGIDLQGDSLQGESPAVETHVAGNFIGLALDGTAAANATGILVGSAAATLIGGEEPDEANRINGGQYGLFAGALGVPAKGLLVEGNLIGRDSANTEVKSPPSTAIALDSAGITDVADTAQLLGNTISAAGLAIEQHGPGAVIAGNEMLGGTSALRAYGSTEGIGNLLEGNLIEATSEAAVVIENDFNEVIGNGIFDAEGAGVLIKPFLTLPANGNLVGGDSTSEENVISGSEGAAVRIVDETGSGEESSNEVARNSGSGNGGLFIDLVGGEANQGIKPPAFSTAIQSSASGSGAQEGATIRLFRKANAEAGELESFLTETTADAGGNWKAAYPQQIPTGTIVAATQTSKGATSELATTTSAADPVEPQPQPKPPRPPTCPAAGPPKCPVTVAPPIPQTKISKGPKAKSHETTAVFKFTSTVKGSSFQCKLDKKPFKSCKSPKKYKRLKPGKHVFKVRAVNSAGKADPTPAKRKFQILP